MNNIILASQSPRRKQLLSWLIDDFKVVPASINEEAFIPLARTPEELVVKLATAKAKSAGSAYPPSRKASEGLSMRSDSIIIAADTVVILDHQGTWEVIGKPKDFTQAEVTLRKLRGTTHLVYSGLCVLNYGTDRLASLRSGSRPVPTIATDFERTEVTFGKFSDEVMNEFIATGKPLEAAGAYMIQVVKNDFNISFKGSYTNIVGLPLEKLSKMLKNYQIEIKPDWEESVKKEMRYED